MNLRGTTAIVTGGAVRLGRAIALRLADEGVNVVVHYHGHTAEADHVAAEITSRGVKAITVRADFESPEVAAKTVFRAAAELGPIQLLVNSAAIFEPCTLGHLTQAQWRRHHAINLETPTFLCQQLAMQLPTERRGHIINIADWRALRPQPGHLAYSIAKSGLVSLTKILAQELGPRIQVNAIAPGAILPGPGEGPEVMPRLALRNPLERTGNPADIADAVVFLLKSPFINGEVLHITGGEELRVGSPSH